MDDAVIIVLWAVSCALQLVLIFAGYKIRDALGKLAQAMLMLGELVPTSKKKMPPCKPEDHLWKRDQKGLFFCDKCGERPAA